MHCYLDSSVVLRKIFAQPNQLCEWPEITVGFSSRLLRLECLRVIQRMRLQNQLSDEATAQCRANLFLTLDHMGELPVTPLVMESAEQPFATPVATLDSIHLATALLWKAQHGAGFMFATHDRQLATVARAHDLRVIGC